MLNVYRLAGVILGVMCGQFAHSQTLPGISTPEVNAGIVFETSADSVFAWYKNTTIDTVVFGSPRLFPFRGDTVHSVRWERNWVAAGDSVRVWVKVKPIHNMVHQLPIFLPHSDPMGTESLVVTFQGRYSQSYYSSTENLEEAALRTALKNKISSNTTAFSYNTARDHMYGSIDNVAGQVECVYTGRIATFNTRAGATANNFNCEHTFPQGFFNSASPMVSDLHHLFSTDETANSQRGNMPFGMVSGSVLWQNGGSKKGTSVFEPRNVHKGAVARAMLYFVLRHQDYASHFSPQEAILRTWHDQYPPVTKDINRNNAIYALQGNRNPFTDYPAFLSRITHMLGTTTTTPVHQLALSDDSLVMVFSPTSSLVRYKRFSIANTGNQPLLFSNFNVSAASIALVQGGGSVTLAPGKIHEVLLSYPAGVDFSQHALTFSSSHPTRPTLVIPLHGKVALSHGEDYPGGLRWSVRSGSIAVWNAGEPSSQTLSLHNVLGQCLLSATLHEDHRSPTTAWQSPVLPSGIYYLHTSQNKSTVTLAIP